MKTAAHNPQHEVLPGPFALAPGSGGADPSPAVVKLVRSQIQALLEASPAYHELAPERRAQMEADLIKIAAYSAALIQEDFAQSQRLGQTPMLKQETILRPLAAAQGRAPLARASADEPRPAADEFSPRAVNQVARITQQTLNAIAFPKFVADLIKGTFQAIVDASIQQMEAYGNLLANVAKTVDQFMADNISDNMARDWLAASYPNHFRVEVGQDGARVRVREGAEERPAPNLRGDLNLSQDVSLDDDSAEETLVPAARRKMAQTRQQLLSTMVLMGINRIVVTSGRIRAQMGFRIDASDTGRAESASQFDLKNEVSYSYGGGLLGWLGGGPSVDVKNTITYVSSSKKESSDEIDVTASLTGEVDLRFKSDYFPLERLARPEMIAAIQGNTPNPATNTPNAPSSPGSGGTGSGN